jgi:hypothetical protein
MKGLREIFVFILLFGTLSLVLYQHMYPEQFEFSINTTYSGEVIRTEPLIKTEQPMIYWLYQNDGYIFLVLVLCAILLGDWRAFYTKMQKK